jgi:hypothetical protein
MYNRSNKRRAGSFPAEMAIMKKIITLLFFVFVIGISQVAFAQNDGLVQLRPGQQKRMMNGRVTIKFISVTDDSRCPTDVNCVWAGNAKIKVQVKVRGGETKTLELDSNLKGNAGTVDAYRIEISSLTPKRRSNDEIKQSDYRAGFSVTKLSR